LAGTGDCAPPEGCDGRDRVPAVRKNWWARRTVPLPKAGKKFAGTEDCAPPEGWEKLAGIGDCALPGCAGVGGAGF